MREIILMHGALGSATDLAPLATELRNLGLAPHTFSFSGHGGEGFKKGFGLAQFATELNDFISAKSLKKPAAFGFSMGGYVALALAASRPEVLSKVITLGTKFDWNPEITAKQVKALDLQSMQEKNPAQAEHLRKTHGEQWQQLVQKTCEMLPKISVESILNKNTLATITSPCLIGIADQDRMVTLEETLEVYKSINGAGMYMLPFSKHQLDSVNYRLLARIIADFIGA